MLAFRVSFCGSIMAYRSWLDISHYFFEAFISVWLLPLIPRTWLLEASQVIYVPGIHPVAVRHCTFAMCAKTRSTPDISISDHQFLNRCLLYTILPNCSVFHDKTVASCQLFLEPPAKDLVLSALLCIVPFQRLSKERLLWSLIYWHYNLFHVCKILFSMFILPNFTINMFIRGGMC